MKIKKISALFGATILFLGALGACSSDDAEGTDSRSGSANESGELTVFAAASLTNAFPDIAEDVFAKDHPNVDVKFSFDGSSSLVEQINAGAPADVFASADENNMAKAGDLASNPQEFTKNTLRLVVPTGNPGEINGFDDLEGKKLVVCAAEVPCGRVTGELANAHNVEFAPVSEEHSVSDVRAKVETGEADAGLIYITDAMAAEDKIDIIEIDGIEDVGTSYMISTIDGASHPDLAEAFVQAVNSDEGQAILAEYGFGAGEGQ